MVTLTAAECRVLGTLIEKAQTTPGQYPLSINALTIGCNQKNNRDPVTNYSEETVYEAIDGLRAKQLVREVMLSGSRVSKFRHVARETLQVSSEELVLLAELWLRGPQPAGELRSHASRMHPLESLESVQATLDGLAGRPEPYVRQVPTRPGERAPRYIQLFCPDLPHVSENSRSEIAKDFLNNQSESDITERIARLERELIEVKNAVDRLCAALGEGAERPNN